MYLHRTFYVRALTKHPDNPFKSEYAHSVYAVLRGARETITWLRNAVRQAPAMVARLAQFWNMGLNAAVCTCETALQITSYTDS
jgi:predicted 2-oxoglutarate/Fe(II)-dependent dioxygenase YbiX